MKYLSRYTHRVAISNSRIVKLEDGHVTFRYKDYADSRKEKCLTLSAEEFLRRFVQHVLPRGFTKIRHYGLLASRQRKSRLTLSRELLDALLVLALLTPRKVEPAERPHCARCGGELFRRRVLAKRKAEDCSSEQGTNTS